MLSNHLVAFFGETIASFFFLWTLIWDLLLLSSPGPFSTSLFSSGQQNQKSLYWKIVWSNVSMQIFFYCCQEVIIWDKPVIMALHAGSLITFLYPVWCYDNKLDSDHEIRHYLNRNRSTDCCIAPHAPVDKAARGVKSTACSSTLGGFFLSLPTQWSLVSQLSIPFGRPSPNHY